MDASKISLGTGGNKPILAVNLKRYRRKAGLTQPALALKSGVKLPTIKALEAGQTPGSPTTLAALAEVLNCTIQDLDNEPDVSNDVGAQILERLQRIENEMKVLTGPDERSSDDAARRLRGLLKNRADARSIALIRSRLHAFANEIDDDNALRELALAMDEILTRNNLKLVGV